MVGGVGTLGMDDIYQVERTVSADPFAAVRSTSHPARAQASTRSSIALREALVRVRVRVRVTLTLPLTKSLRTLHAEQAHQG